MSREGNIHIRLWRVRTWELEIRKSLWYTLRYKLPPGVFLEAKVKIFKALLLFSTGHPGSSCRNTLGFVFLYEKREKKRPSDSYAAALNVLLELRIHRVTATCEERESKEAVECVGLPQEGAATAQDSARTPVTAIELQALSPVTFWNPLLSLRTTTLFPREQS
ncbi:hypothetical protein EYF80_017138 [Liparis tanakae]|uniref:Uncharacterized protein n=1 Tax=Liparis tanakae TaxID=230148 RepID=A0A4Z2I3N8_9TELE|nr:hypothetical protein EYF80_017138 [Liparis tanakae]